ncbi:YcxB family protein [Lacrimispora sp.]|uniref:YcxB family protein n=1 Tax=Lacrimispora sp. TaxID=2719234 RepID=UPI00285874D8|nr:YcxB family protein [Lacrimispora sp.]MDR7813117.1 YcxB family protein [Lacrimispora sp.]
MTLNYNITKDDYFDYCMYNYDHNHIVKKQILLVRLLYGSIILLASLAIIIFSFTDYPLLYAAILWIMSIILIGNAKRSIRKTNEKQYRKQILAGQGSEFIGSYTLELNDNGIVVSQPSKKSEIGYDTVKRVVRDEHCMYVYCGSLSAILIPLKVFENEGQKVELLEFLQNKCDELQINATI